MQSAIKPKSHYPDSINPLDEIEYRSQMLKIFSFLQVCLVKSSGADRINQKNLQGTLHKMSTLKYFMKTDSAPSLWLENGQETNACGKSSPKVQRSSSGSSKRHSTGSSAGISLWTVPFHSSEEETVLLLIKFADDRKLGEGMGNNKDVSVLQFVLGYLIGGAHLSIYTSCNTTRCKVMAWQGQCKAGLALRAIWFLVGVY